MWLLSNEKVRETDRIIENRTFLQKFACECVYTSSAFTLRFFFIILDTLSHTQKQLLLVLRFNLI
jgi:hypothetical protein